MAGLKASIQGFAVQSFGPPLAGELIFSAIRQKFVFRLVFLIEKAHGGFGGVYRAVAFPKPCTVKPGLNSEP